MDLLFQHKLRQRERSTWAWAEHPSEDTQGEKEGGPCVDGSKLSSSADTVPSGKWGAATGNQQQMSDQEQMLGCRRNQQCCCETLENALVTIDILRSKLVSEAVVIRRLQYSQNVLLLYSKYRMNAVIYSGLEKLKLLLYRYICSRALNKCIDSSSRAILRSIP